MLTICPHPFPESLSIPLLHLSFLKSPLFALSHVFFFAACSSVPFPPSPCPPSISILAFCSAILEQGYLCWLASCADQAVHTTCSCPARAAANCIKKASFLRAFSLEKGIIQPFSLLYQRPIFIKLLGEEDFWDLCPEGIVRCGWNWLACSRSLGSGLTDRLVAWFHYTFP